MDASREPSGRTLASKVCCARFYPFIRGTTEASGHREREPIKPNTNFRERKTELIENVLHKVSCTSLATRTQLPWQLSFWKRVKSTNSHLPTWIQKSPRMVPGLESAGLVSPSITRPVFTTFSPSQTFKDKRRGGQRRKPIPAENLKTTVSKER